MIRFKFLTGDVNTTYGGKWWSNKQNNGEFDYFFVIELINWEHSVGERDAPRETYNVALTVVSPQQVGEEKMQQAYSCCDITDEMLAIAKTKGYLEAVQVEALHSYASGVPIWNDNGNNWRKLMKQAKQEALNCQMLFGFYLDRPVNRMGETGWEALKLTNVREVMQYSSFCDT